MEHLTDADITGYCNGTLAPTRLLSADKHLQGCGDCRMKALRGAGAAISAGLFGPAGSPHIRYEELAAYADANLPEPDRARVISHLDLCPQCRAEADDLCRFRAELKPPPKPRRTLWITAVSAAAGVLVAVLLWRFAQTPPSEFAGIVDDTLRLGRIEAPAAVMALRGKPGVLRGAPADVGFAVLRPVATAVASPRPRFEWSTAGVGARYVVSIFDPELRPIARSESLPEPHWTPPAPLPAGEYLWQVDATAGGKSFVAPGPPAPSARFLVLDAAATQPLERAASLHPGDHLLLGILYGRAGLLDDAERELRAANPAKAKPLLDSLR